LTDRQVHHNQQGDIQFHQRYSSLDEPFLAERLDDVDYLPLNKDDDQNKIDNIAISQQNLHSKITELAHRLSHGFYKLYIVWLYVFTILSALQIIHTVIFTVYYWDAYAFISLIYLSWMTYQCMLEINAIKTRSLVKANRAMKFMIIFILINIAAIVIFAILHPRIEGRPRKESSAFWKLYLLIFLWSYYCVLLFIHLCANLLGAVKVKKILARMQVLQLVCNQGISSKEEGFNINTL